MAPSNDRAPSDDQLGPPDGTYRYAVGGQLSLVLVILLTVVWLPPVVRSDGTPLALKVLLVAVTPIAVVWTALHTLLPPISVNTSGVQVRQRTRLVAQLYRWEDVIGYCSDTFADRQLALVLENNTVVALPEVKEQGHLERQLAKRASRRIDPRSPGQ